MSYKITYCPNCKWAFSFNTAEAIFVNECPACRRKYFYFAQSEDLAELKAFVNKNNIKNCEWLNVQTP